MCPSLWSRTDCRVSVVCPGDGGLSSTGMLLTLVSGPGGSLYNPRFFHNVLIIAAKMVNEQSGGEIAAPGVNTARAVRTRHTIPRFSRRMSRYVGFLILIIAVLTGAAGCLSTTFGDVAYSGDALKVHVENTGRSVENAVLQVTIMEVGTLEQHEAFSEARYVSLDKGKNEYTIQVSLKPGSYRLFLTVFVDGERRASVIRDLEVAP